MYSIGSESPEAFPCVYLCNSFCSNHAVNEVLNIFLHVIVVPELEEEVASRAVVKHMKKMGIKMVSPFRHSANQPIHECIGGRLEKHLCRPKRQVIPDFYQERLLLVAHRFVQCVVLMSWFEAILLTCFGIATKGLTGDCLTSKGGA